jgi:hypothetical protein
MKKFLKTYIEWKLNEEAGTNTPQIQINRVLSIWQESDPEGWTADLIQNFESNGFNVKTLHEISGDGDIPDKSVIFTYQDDPSDLCYYKYGSEIFTVTMGILDPEPLDFKDETLEELIGVDFNSEYYENLIIAVSDPNADWQNITKSDLEDLDFNISLDDDYDDFKWNQDGEDIEL